MSNLAHHAARISEWVVEEELVDEAYDSFEIEAAERDESFASLRAMLALQAAQISESARTMSQILAAEEKPRRHEFVRTRRQHRLEQRFARLVSEWKADVALESSLTRMFMSAPYQQIIGIGPAAIPLILEELRREPDHWFWALTAITGDKPAEAAETLDDATEIWLSWGRARGYIG